MKFIRAWLSILVLALTLGAVQGTPGGDFAFERFMNLALPDYPNWLRAHNLDPTPVVPDSVDLTGSVGMFNSTGEIKNQRIYNHSVITNWMVQVDTDIPSFAVILVLPHYWAIGEYQAEGFVGETPFNGSGECNLTAKGIDEFFRNPLLSVPYENFTLTPDGYLNLSSATGEPIFAGNHDGVFDGMIAGGNEYFVGGELASIYSTHHIDWIPLQQYLSTFLEELFAKTPYADIIKP